MYQERIQDLRPTPASFRRLAALTARVFLLGGLWLVLAGADPSAWIIGAPAVLAAAWAWWRLDPMPGGRLSISGLIGFVPFFLWHSLLGALDVSSRVLRPKPAIAPGFASYRMKLTRGDARVFFSNLVSLLPGTLSAEIRGRELRIHALDARQDPTPALAALEARVAAIFPETGGSQR